MWNALLKLKVSHERYEGIQTIYQSFDGDTLDAVHNMVEGFKESIKALGYVIVSTNVKYRDLTKE